MSTIVIMQMPEPSKSKEARPLPEKIPVEAEVRDMIECIESGEDSAVQWITLNKLYGAIKDRKDSRALNLKKMIEPTLAKYGQHGVALKDGR